MASGGQTAASVTVPDTKLAREATELVRESATDLVYNHSRRVFWFGSLQGRYQRVSFVTSSRTPTGRNRQMRITEKVARSTDYELHGRGVIVNMMTVRAPSGDPTNLASTASTIRWPSAQGRPFPAGSRSG
jgi:hypothetical protein